MVMPGFKNSIFKIILIGDSCVGKTSLGQSISNGVFSDHYKATVGFDMISVNLTMDNAPITLNIIDSAGLERHLSLTNNFYRGADGVILCFDVTNETSFTRIDLWKNSFLSTANPSDPENFPFIVCGNKIDLNKQIVEDFKVERWCMDNFDIPYIKTSAKTREGVEELFITLARKIKKFHTDHDHGNSISQSQIDNFQAPIVTDTSSRCC